MRPEEVAAMETIVKFYGGSFKEGEDPPDAYLTLEEKSIAVEITYLIERVVHDKNKSRSRLNEDSPALTICYDLENEIGNIIPKDRRVILILTAPLKNVKKLKNKIKEKIIDMLKEPNGTSIEGLLNGQKVYIEISLEAREHGNRISGFVQNSNSSANIAQNASLILRDRIETKSKKCSKIKFKDEIWLALINDYFLADIDTYRSALTSLNLCHIFDKILLIDEGKTFEL